MTNSKIKCSKVDFGEIMYYEMKAKGVIVDGDNEEEIEANRRYKIARYYDILNYLTASEIKQAFIECDKHLVKFPAPSQLIKHAPRQRVVIENPTIPQKVKITPEMQAKIDRINSGKTLYKVDDGTMKLSKVMIKKRWPNTNCEKTYARLDEENNNRPERPKEKNQ